MVTRMTENMDMNTRGCACVWYSGSDWHEKKEEEEEFTPSIELLKSISFLAVILTL